MGTKREVLRNLKLARNQIDRVISEMEVQKDWKVTYTNIIQAIKLIKFATRKFILYNMLKTTSTSDFIKLNRNLT